MLTSVLICVAAFAALVLTLRRSQVSLGLPIAYLGSLLLLHVPGAVAHILDQKLTLPGRAFTQVGIQFTALGAVCFLAGVWVTHFKGVAPTPRAANRTTFWHFCLVAGWICTTLGFVFNVPSFGALLQRGGPIWMLAIMLALRSAAVRRDLGMMARWLLALTFYPALILLLGGFLSYGTTAVIIVLSGLAITAASNFRVALATTVATVVGISIFLSYFEHRNAIRDAVWGGASSDARIEATLDAARDVTVFDPANPEHMKAMDARLNQNFFVGVAAARIAAGRVDYLHGRSLWDGMLSLIPRALWPEKPVTAGSGTIVAQMTGLRLARGTSFGVGNVMEFQINFGIAGVVVGFLLLGIALGRLDRLAAVADATGNLGDVFIFFVPAVALIQPNGSIVEIVSGAAAGLAAAFGWRWAWKHWPQPYVPPEIAIGQSLAAQDT